MKSAQRSVRVVSCWHLPLHACVLLLLVLSGAMSALAEDAVIAENTTWAEGEYTYDNVVIQSGATLTCEGVVHVHATNFAIAAGAAVSADGQGYGTGQGPGGSSDYNAGGSHGGRGSGSSGPTYGSPTEPTDMGSGGGGAYGGWSAGGGAIRLDVSGTLTLDGQITANGMSGGGNNGGGAGGSVWITTGALTGPGFIAANGNHGNSADGGGGRIAVYYNDASTYTGFTNCTAGAGGADAEVGTVGFFDTSLPNGHMWVFESMLFGSDSVLHYGAVTLADGAALILGGNSTLDVDGGLRLQDGALLTLQGVVAITAQNVTVETGAAIDGDGQGYGTGAGPGAGTSYSAGGSHGGRGSGDSGPTYDDPLQPIDMGSGGGGASGGWSYGGGALRLDVSGTLTLGGQISVNGVSGGGNNGGAAGGSVWITTDMLTGAGFVTANGNDGSNADGGGGRIAVYYSDASTYTGFASCTADPGGAEADAGTVAFFDATNNRLGVFTNMVFGAGSTLHYDAATVAEGAALVLGEDSTLQVDNALTMGTEATFTFGGGSTLSVDGPLAIGSQATLVVQGKNISAQIEDEWQGEGGTIVAGDMIIETDGAISADGQGYGTGAGPGGSSDFYVGGSHGGRGSGSSGPTYGDPIQPTDLGSAGGGAYGGWSRGGGAIRLEVIGTLTLDGQISANGMSAGGNNSGGAGGSVWITAGTLVGDGYITASGHQGRDGDGGGGRIAVYYSDASTYTGSANCTADAGGEGAGAGTVVFFDTSVSNAHMSVFERMVFGSDSVLHYGAVSLADGAELVLGGGSILEVDGLLTVGSNATLVLEGKNTSAQIGGQWCGQGGTMTVGDMTVETDGAISADGKGYGTGWGPGGSVGYTTGGSHGGSGSGNSGPTYGNRMQPTDLGSAGGGAYGGWSCGGGAIRLDVNGTLTLDGRITANGMSAGGNNAGAAGGSVWITANTFTGAGTVTANGNQGGSAEGGGGRIAVYYQNYAFAGTVTADGPGNARDGTIYLCRQSDIALGQSIEAEAEAFAGHIFRLQSSGPPPGVLLVRLVSLDGGGDWGLLGRYGTPPSEGVYNWYGVGPTDDTPPAYEMLVPVGSAGNYYFGILYSMYEEAAPRFRIECIEAPVHYVASLGLGSGSNAGSTTIGLRGVGFDANTRIALRDGAGATLRTFSPVGTTATGLSVTMDLTSLDPQIVDVVVVWADGHEEVLENAFEITGAQPGRLAGEIEIPSQVRALRAATFWVEYSNTGGSDINAPLLYVMSEDGMAMRLSPTNPFERKPIKILAINDTNPVGVIPPGACVRIPVQFIPEGPGHTILTFSVTQLDDDSSEVDWDGMKDEARPSGISDEAWDIVWAHLADQTGSTTSGFLARLRENAQYLADHGRRTYDVDRLLDLEFSAAAAGTGMRTPQTVAVDASTATKALGLSFARFAAGTINGRLAEGPLGRGWSHNFQIHITFQDTDTAVVHMLGGFIRRFVSSPLGAWLAEPNDLGRFEEISGGYRLTDKGAATWTFDSAGRLVSVTDPNGNSITLTYTGDDLTSLQHSNGETFVLAYDDGLISSLTDHAGRQTLYEYSGDMLTSVAGPEETVTTYTYVTAESASQYALESITYPDGSHHYFTYDDLGRLTSQARDGGEQLLTYSYPSLGTVEIQDAFGATTAVTFDGNDGMTQFTTPLGRSITTDLGPHERVAQWTLPGGDRMQTTYASDGYPTGYVDALGNTTTVVHTADHGRLDWFRDARGTLTDYVYDNRGNMTGITYPDMSEHQFERDLNGYLTKTVNRLGEEINLSRNQRGSITQKQVAGGDTVTVEYDTVGRATRISDAYGDIVLGYDGLDRIIDTDYPNGHGFSFAYDKAGRRTQRVGDDGFTLDYVYDAVGRLAEIRDGTGALVVGYEYDDAGYLGIETKGNGTYTTYEYDLDGRLGVLTHYGSDDLVQAQFSYAYDQKGRRVSTTTLDGSTTYAYDGADRLTGITYPDGSYETYTYDVLGNRTQVVTDGGTAVYATNSMNQYTQVGTDTCSYDAAGNLTARGTTTYEYDAENRLVRVVTADQGTWEYAYDALGRRVAADHDGVVTRYVYDLQGFINTVAEYDNGGALTARYVYGHALAARLDAAGNAAYYAYDGSGNTRLMTDADGEVVNTYDYSPFGSERVVSETVSNPFRFCGAYGVMQEDHGLVHMRARYYDPVLGRFVSSDPVGIRAGLNLYTYASNNPISLSDPSGLDFGIGSLFSGNRPNLPQMIQLLQNAPVNSGMSPQQVMSTLMGILSANGISPTGQQGSGLGNQTTFPSPGGMPGMPSFPSSLDMPVENQMYMNVQQQLQNLLNQENLTQEQMQQIQQLYQMLHNILKSEHDAKMNCIRNLKGKVTVCPGGTTICEGNTEVITPNDPNEKVGPAGQGDAGVIRVDDELYYTIYFENKPDASAPAQEVVVTDVLDTNLDLSSLILSEIAWGDHVLAIPGDVMSFSGRESIVDYRPEVGKSWFVDVTAGMDSGALTWRLKTVDPETGDYPEDVLAGFLPPNDDTGRGEGHVTFRIMPKPDSLNGTIITNMATIVFDTEAAIDTNEVQNLIGVFADVNGSATVDAIDVQLVINEALGISTAYQCDLNGDDQVNALDVQLVINAALGIPT